MGMRVLAVLLVVLLIPPVVTHAGSADHVVEAVKEGLKEREPGRVLVALTDGEGLLIKDPEAALLACGYVQVYIRSLAEDATGDERKVIRQMIEKLVSVAEKTVEKDERSADAHRTLGYALGAKGRGLRALGDPLDPAVFQGAARAAREAGYRDKAESGSYFGAALAYLGEAAPADKTACLAWYATEFARLQKEIDANSGNIDVTIEHGHLCRAYIHALLKKKDKRTAKTVALSAIAAAETVRLNMGIPWVEASMTHNAMVRLGKVLGLPKTLKFRTEPGKSRWRLLEYELPVGWTSSSGSGEQHLNTIRRREIDGSTSIQLHIYQRSVDYVDIDDKVAGGDNLTGLADMDRKGLRSIADRVKREKKRVGGKLSKTIKKTIGFELCFAIDDEVEWHRSYYFKGENHKYTFLVAVRRVGGATKIDEELKHFLSTIRETPPSK